MQKLMFLPYFLQPSPELSPTMVVKIQLAALQRNGKYDRHFGVDFGIAAAFVFASPSNKLNTGPLSRFMRMVRNPIYRPMIDHQEAYFGKLVINGNQAWQKVTLIDKEGKMSRYIFGLSRQGEGQYWQCWMTDSVQRED
jgi:Domain of unknown function (DUF4864)